MKSTYYEILTNDGSPVGIETTTLKAARKEIKELIKEDEELFGFTKDVEIHYYIKKTVEVEKNGTIYAIETYIDE